ncbi:MAG TPA: lysophospholipid acyltransferase family protein [Acidimicrobiales bacterium]|nr:lysophospholipid acyltransferase family protein [Acidimicrobiales bacterium]
MSPSRRANARAKGARIPYQIVRFLIWLVAKLYWRVTFEGLDKVPRNGPFVLAPVHRSFIDFGLVSAVTRRRMGYMGKESLWNSKLLGSFITMLGAYPVNRGAPDRDALRRTLALLETGEPLVLFPEGTRRTGPVIEHLHEGAAFVASRAGVPLVPVGIGGSERALPKGKAVPRPVKIHILVGDPLYPAPLAEGARHPSRRAVKELTLRLQGVLQDLFDRAQRRAGVDIPVNQSSGPDVSPM